MIPRRRRHKNFKRSWHSHVRINLKKTVQSLPLWHTSEWHFIPQCFFLDRYILIWFCCTRLCSTFLLNPDKSFIFEGTLSYVLPVTIIKLTFIGAVSVPSISNKQIILSLCNMILNSHMFFANEMQWFTNTECVTAKWNCLTFVLEKN